MEYCYALPFEISFYQGLFSFIVFSILLIIFTNVDIKDEKYKDYIKIEYNGKKYIDNLFDYTDKIDIKKLIAFIVMMITRLCFNLFSNIIVLYFTPSHVAFFYLEK